MCACVCLCLSLVILWKTYFALKHTDICPKCVHIKQLLLGEETYIQYSFFIDP